MDAYLGRQLAELKTAGLFRDPADANTRLALEARAQSLATPLVDASSNDYLGLARGLPGTVSRETGEAAPGAGASRLVQGTRAEHEALEADAASWVRQESALLFSSGYSANLGVLAALTSPDAAVLSDSLNHASLVDGCRLGRGRVAVVPHLDLAALETTLATARGAATRWVVTESYFSMDGDAPNLRALRALCDRYRAFLIVDEAHALGVFGPAGAGLCAAAEVKPDVLLGTFGKAVGTQGAFAAGSEILRTFLWNRARTFVFSTASSPELCVRTRVHLQAARAADASRQALAARCSALREKLAEERVPVVTGSFGPIVPVLVGSSAQADRVASALRERGILAQPIRPPSVPEGTARIRITVSERWADVDVDYVARSIGEACRA